MKLKTNLKYALITALIWFTCLSISIYSYSKKYSNQKSDVAIVLGAGSHNGIVSLVFKERLNQAIKLYDSKKVEYIIVTGGFGVNEEVSDSQAGKDYLLSCGLKMESVLIEEKSTITQTNLTEAKSIMEAQNFNSALIVSDPLHMKRAMALSSKLGLLGESSPTQTTMYRSWKTKASSLCYETFYYTVELILGDI
jgi:uncharacterized SAM-binding protein YcdF (DUF218 family)